MKKFSEMKFVKPNFAKIEAKLTGLINQFKNAETVLEQSTTLKKVYKYLDSLTTNFTIAEIRYTLNTQDKKYQKAQELLDEIQPQISGILFELDKAIVESKFKTELEEIFGSHLMKLTEVSLKSFDPRVISEIQTINKLSSAYTRLISSAQIEFQGKVLNLSQLGKFTVSPDRNIRKEAALLQAKFFEDNEQEIGDIYDQMVKTRDQMAKKLGYKNFVELGYYSLGRTDYNAEMVAKYRDQIYNDLIPLTNQLFKKQIKRLGIKKPQYYDYNIYFNSGNATPKGDTEKLVEYAQTMYSELSPETDYFFKFMRDYELLDLEARAGKSGGGYMTYLPLYKAPFIFSNFNGTSGDVDVLTHEFGHAFQGYMSRNISIPSYRSPTLEACEIHSMSMEFFAYPWMNLFFKEEEEKYRFSHLSGALTFIPYGVTVDEFQHWVYENPNATHQERCAAFREIEKKYLPHKEYAEAPVYERGGWWMKQSHIFSSPFYYIDYTLAQVVAFQFFIENNKNHAKAWKKYVRLCKLGGKYPFVELLEKAKLNNPFNDGTVAKVIRPLKKYLAAINDKAL